MNYKTKQRKIEWDNNNENCDDDDDGDNWESNDNQIDNDNEYYDGFSMEDCTQAQIVSTNFIYFYWR
jgi:hypothetical protein